MTRLEQRLSQYAAYHLNQKNILTHFIGIPSIVFSVLCFTVRVSYTLNGFQFSLALLLLIVGLIYYFRLDLIFGSIMLLIFAIAYPLAHFIAHLSFSQWLSWSLVFFVIGWLFQFVGHFYEKKKPAFMDDLIGLAIGPLFVLAEVIFMLGMRKNLQSVILIEAHKQRARMDH